MSLSFVMTRAHILQHSRNVQTLIEMYPFVNDIEQVYIVILWDMCEFSLRTLGDKYMQQIVDESWCSTAQLRWEKVTKKILNQVSVETEHKNHLRGVLDE